MSVEIKVYLTREQNEENLCFHAIVNAANDFDVFIDLNETYELLMVSALNGNLKFEYFNNENFNKEVFEITTDNYEQNLNAFVNFLQDFYGLTVVSQQTNLCEHFGVRLVGAGFRGNQNSPMLETAQFNAMNSIHVIKTQLFVPANNTEYKSDDIYIKKAHGSLKLTLEATKRYEEPINFIRSIYEDIENEVLDPFRFTDKEQQYRYQTIVKNLNELNKQKRLQQFFVIIDGEELEITKRDYLKQQSKNIYNENVEIVGVFEAYKTRTDSFEIYADGVGKFYCHLDQLSKNDFPHYENLIDIIKSLDNFETNRLKVTGQKIKPQTINVSNIELV